MSCRKTCKTPVFSASLPATSPITIAVGDWGGEAEIWAWVNGTKSCN